MHHFFVPAVIVTFKSNGNTEFQLKTGKKNPSFNTYRCLNCFHKSIELHQSLVDINRELPRIYNTLGYIACTHTDRHTHTHKHTHTHTHTHTRILLKMNLFISSWCVNMSCTLVRRNMFQKGKCYINHVMICS